MLSSWHGEKPLKVSEIVQVRRRRGSGAADAC